MEKKTAGQIALELEQKDTQDNPIDLQRAILSKDKFDEQFQKCLSEGKNSYPGDFFICWLTWRHNLSAKSICGRMFCRQTPPGPSFGQTVWRYVRKHDAYEELWTIPLAEVCAYYMTHMEEISPEEYPLLENVVKFVEKQYDELYKKLILLYNKPVEHQLTSSKTKIITEI